MPNPSEPGRSNPDDGTVLNVLLDGSSDFSMYPSGEFVVQWEHRDNEVGAQYQVVQSAKPLNNCSYTVKQSDCGKYISAKLINVDRYKDCASCGTWVFVYKQPNDGQPVKPILDVSGSYLVVTNGVKGQEYAVEDRPDLTEAELTGHWTQRPASNGSFLMDGALTNQMNYVYTRDVETETTLPGSVIAVSGAFVGSSTQTRGISLTHTNLTRPDSDPFRAYDVMQITASPLPANATDFSGIPGNQWSAKVDGMGSNSYMSFYADAACTVPVASNSSYYTVYAKSATKINNVRVQARFVSAAGNSSTGSFLLNIAGTDGYYKCDGITIPELPELLSGTIVSGVPFQTVPAGASTANLNFANPASHSYNGLWVTLNASKMTLTFDASNCSPNTYVKELRIRTTKLAELTFEVLANTTPIESLVLKTHEWTAPARTTTDANFTVVVNPTNANGDALVWSSSNPALASVTGRHVTSYGSVEYYGAVHFTGAAKPGDSVNITVSGNGHSDVLHISFVDSSPHNPFVDVHEEDPFYNAVLWAYYHRPYQVTAGMDETHFGPNLTVTRAQAMVFFWAAQGKPEPSTTPARRDGTLPSARLALTSDARNATGAANRPPLWRFGNFSVVGVALTPQGVSDPAFAEQMQFARGKSSRVIGLAGFRWIRPGSVIQPGWIALRAIVCFANRVAHPRSG